MTPSTEYDPRYLDGIAQFNRGDYFEAHEVWEDLWHETTGPDRRFYQGLIQASVAVYHAGNGNARGAKRLFHSGRKYMSVYPKLHLGLDVLAFWAAMEQALGDCLSESAADSCVLSVELVPKIVLSTDAPDNSLW